MSDDTTRILSIDGGGIRGVIPAVVLAELEDECKAPVHELFDVVAGTSTGALIALGLTVPPVDRETPLEARELVDFYNHEGREIFQAPITHKLASVGRLAGPKYPDEELEAVLEERFQGRSLTDAMAEVIVPTYDLAERDSFFFKTRRAEAGEGPDHPIEEVARAAVAAPTYFEPAPAEGPEDPDEPERRVLLDGGLVANNPAMCAYVEALSHDDHPDDVFVVSLGTGELSESYELDEARDWGGLSWLARLFGITMDGPVHAVDHQLEHVLDPEDYHRLQPPLTLAADRQEEVPDDALDAASRLNVERLEEVGRELLVQREDALDAIAERLAPETA